MSQEILTLLRNKNTKKTVVLDYVCGRGDYQNIVIYNMLNADEIVVTKDNSKIQRMLKDLGEELNMLSKELDASLAHLAYVAVKSVSSQNFEIAKQYDEYTDVVIKNLQEEWLSSYDLVSHLYSMINQADSLANDIGLDGSDWEVVLSVSY